METATLLTIVVMGAVFALWAVSMFRLLWKLNKAKSAKAKELGLSPYSLNIELTPGVFASALSAPEFAPDRKRLLILTPLMFLTIAISSQVLRTQ